MFTGYRALQVQTESDERSFTERRAATRVLVALVGVVTFDSVREGPRLIEVMASDVSTEGAYLWLVDPTACPCVGDKVKMNLSATSELDRFHLSVNATGIVVRVDQPRKSRHGFAVKFAHFDDL